METKRKSKIMLYSMYVLLAFSASFFLWSMTQFKKNKPEQLKPMLMVCLYDKDGHWMVIFDRKKDKNGLYIDPNTGRDLGVAIELTTYAVGCPELTNDQTTIQVLNKPIPISVD